mmetsp:Transcript_48336/g.105226  ORF Transcript_48336/g.105226 Transcript_48336/m.105226 type:complete len:296 (+) Transcript_48336:24-911(+)
MSLLRVLSDEAGVSVECVAFFPVVAQSVVLHADGKVEATCELKSGDKFVLPPSCLVQGAADYADDLDQIPRLLSGACLFRSTEIHRGAGGDGIVFRAWPLREDIAGWEPEAEVWYARHTTVYSSCDGCTMACINLVKEWAPPGDGIVTSVDCGPHHVEVVVATVGRVLLTRVSVDSLWGAVYQAVRSQSGLKILLRGSQGVVLQPCQRVEQIPALASLPKQPSVQPERLIQAALRGCFVDCCGLDVSLATTNLEKCGVVVDDSVQSLLCEFRGSGDDIVDLASAVSTLVVGSTLD